MATKKTLKAECHWYSSGTGVLCPLAFLGTCENGFAKDEGSIHHGALSQCYKCQPPNMLLL